MDFEGWLYVAAGVWFVLNLVRRVWGEGKKAPPPRESYPEPPRERPERGLQPDATQQEGQALEIALGRFQRALREAGPTGRPARFPLPGAEEVEERASLEVEPEVASLEQEVRRAARREYTQDEEAEEIVARRITAASARDATRTKADHVKFDNQIRQEPADHTATRGYTAEQLRHAVVWREILGPPVSIREESGER